MVCGLLYAVWAVVLYVGSCMKCGVLYDMSADVCYIWCCVIYVLRYDMWVLYDTCVLL